MTADDSMAAAESVMDLKTRLTQRLADVYEDEATARMVSKRVGLSLRNIDFGGGAEVVWTRIVERAVSKKRIENLIEYADNDYPDDIFREALQALKDNPKVFNLTSLESEPSTPAGKLWHLLRLDNWITLVTLFGAIGSIGSTIIIRYFQESHTTIKITGVGREFITISAENRGHRPSTLDNFKLTFDKSDLPVTQDNIELIPLPEHGRSPQRRLRVKPTPDAADAEIRLAAVATLKVTCSPAVMCREDVRSRLAKGPLTLHTVVEESGNPWYVWEIFRPKSHRYADTKIIDPEVFKADIPDFIEGVCCHEQE